MGETTIAEADLLAFSKVFGDEAVGLREREISVVLDFCGITDISPDQSTERRIFDALQTRQDKDGNRRAILAFIRVAMDPKRFEGEQERYEKRRLALNEALALCGFEVTQDGTLREPESAKSFSNLMATLWSGDIPLVKTFWLYYFVGGYLVAFPFYISRSGVIDNIIVVFLLLSWVPVWILYFVLVMVAVWRSANKYTGPPYWVTLAKGMVGVGVITSLVTMLVVFSA
jgi:hypothetical protein